MVVLIVLFTSWLAFRGIGALGYHAFATWYDSARYALAVMFTFTGISHFTKLKDDMVRMMPAKIPNPLLMVYITGALELAGAVGILVPQTRSLAGTCLILFLLAVFPANIKAAKEQLSIGRRPATALWLRAPMQLLFIGLLWWATLR